MTIVAYAQACHAKPYQGGWLGHCPAHSDSHESLSIREINGKIIFHCFAGCPHKKVRAAFADMGIGSRDAPPKPRKPAPAAPKERARAVARYDYHNAAGELVYQVVRYEPKTFRQRRPDGKGGWLWKLGADAELNLPEVSPVPYQLPALLKNDKTTVLVVEGEKDVLTAMEHGFVATTNSGGAGAAKVVWSRIGHWLESRNVVIIPDNDEPGRTWATECAQILARVAARVRVLHLPNLAEKQDLTDWFDGGGTHEALVELAKSCPDWAIKSEPVAPDAPPAPVWDGESPDLAPPPPTAAPAAPMKFGPPDLEVKVTRLPVIALGHFDRNYYFLPADTGRVMAMSTSQLSTPAGLMDLAPLEVWSTFAPSKSSTFSRAQAQQVAEMLVNECKAVGPFDPLRCRGRGVWRDDEKIVVHCGDRLLVDGEQRNCVNMKRTRQDFLYEAGPSIQSPFVHKPCSDDDALQVLSLLQLLQWKRPLDPLLLFGWLAVAPLCGILRWRPHIWITGSHGTGKTWTLEEIVRPLLGSWALSCQSTTTEAGLRGALKRDARPVVFDELEDEAVRPGDSHIANLLALFRQSSADSGDILKGGHADFGGGRFLIRSCFCVSSIGVSIERGSDQSRFSLLELQQRPDNLEHFHNNIEPASKCISRLAAGWRARVFAAAPHVDRNVEVFSQVAAEQLGTQRLGDQVGTLLAGAYSVLYQRQAELDDVQKLLPESLEAMVRTYTEGRGGTDSRAAFQWMLQAKLDVELFNGRVVRRSVAEMLMNAAGKRSDQFAEISQELAIEILRRSGFSWNETGVYVSTTHRGVKEIMRGTRWQSNWTQHLARIEGAKASEKTQNFGGTKTPAMWVPWEE